MKSERSTGRKELHGSTMGAERAPLGRAVVTTDGDPGQATDTLPSLTPSPQPNNAQAEVGAFSFEPCSGAIGKVGQRLPVLGLKPKAKRPRHLARDGMGEISPASVYSSSCRHSMVT